MKKFLIGFTIFLLFITLLPLLPIQAGIVRIWSFPRLQIAVLMLLALIGWMFHFKTARQYYYLVLPMMIAMVYQGSKFIPYTFVWPPEIVDTQSPDKEQELSLLFYNVRMDNDKTGEFLQLADTVNADIILMAETDEKWSSAMQPLYSRYPYKVEVPLSNTYGMCLYSKLPLSATEVKYLVEPDIPSIHTQVTLPGGKIVKLYCIHPEPPTAVKSTKDRDAELVIVAREIEKETMPVIVAGDLNDVAWSSTTGMFGRISKCLDPRVGRGLLSTFNAKYPFLRWPLDHFFTSRHFTLNHIERLPDIGSDHFPITMRVTLNPEGGKKNKVKQSRESDREKASEKLEEEKEEDKGD